MSIKDYLPAPTENKEILLKAAEITAAHCQGISDKETLVESLLYAWKNATYTDGYHLAKILDEYCNYDVDSSFVSDLDEMEYNVDRLIKDAREKWIKDNNIQPELEIGTVLHHVNNGPGTIVGSCEYYIGYYLVERECDKIQNSKLLVKWEDALIKG